MQQSNLLHIDYILILITCVKMKFSSNYIYHYKIGNLTFIHHSKTLYKPVNSKINEIGFAKTIHKSLTNGISLIFSC